MSDGTVHIQNCPACDGPHLLAPEKFRRVAGKVLYTCSVYGVKCAAADPSGRAMVRPDHTPLNPPQASADDIIVHGRSHDAK